MKLTITNETVYHAGDIRSLVLACCKWLDITRATWCGKVRVGYSRRGGFTGGYAYYNGGSVAIFLPAPDGRQQEFVDDPEGKSQRLTYTISTTPEGHQIAHDPKPVRGNWKMIARSRIDENGHLLPQFFNDAAWTIEHELLHTKNVTHRQMRRDKHPAHHGRHDRPPVWAEGLKLSVKPAAKPLPPEERKARAAAKRAARFEAAAARDIESLARWQRKAKLAATKIRSLKARIQGRARRQSKSPSSNAVNP